MNLPYRKILLAVALVLIGLAALYQLPPIHNRLAWRVDNLITWIKYTVHPPEEAVFVPQEPLPTVTPTLALNVSPTALPDTPDLTPTNTSQPPTPTTGATSTPLPEYVKLDNVTYVKQNERWNYCGPANLTMALNYWGWPGDRDDVARAIKPGVDNPKLDFIQRGRSDKNVLPSEMVDFVAEHTDLSIVARHGGELELIKELIANGFPVLVEKGTYREDFRDEMGWMGHYMFTTGYDEGTDEFIVQDSLIKDGNTAADHKNMRLAYGTYLEGWRSFNYLFMVIYPSDRQTQVYELLGPWGDPQWSYQHALERAEAETESLEGINRFFAWFNKGTSLVKLQRYQEAAAAYDQAFQVYAELESDDTQRPYRIMWYQTGPYMAYYYSGRYQDTLNLANHTLNETISEPELEESLYWRGLAKEALGNIDGAIADLRKAVHLNKNFDIAAFHLNRLLNQ